MVRSAKWRDYVWLWLAAVVPAQRAPDPAAQRSDVAEAIRLWIDDYQGARLTPGGPLRPEPGLQPRYAAIARRAGALADRDLGTLTHLDALQKLMFAAEADLDEVVAESLLSLAAVGFDRSVVDRDAAMLRDLGHWSLMRSESDAVWFAIARAAGEPPPVEPAATDPVGVDPARRVAALRLLGMKGRPVFRATIEAALADVEPRVRLAGVEALDVQRRPESLSVLVRLTGLERHPIVSQATIRALAATMTATGSELAAEDRQRAIRAAMHMFSRCGWRTDMDLVDFVEAWPDAAAVPPLIEILDRKPDRDRLENIVNKDASPLLRARAHECLRGLTGAIIPADQPAQWRDFWRRERDNVHIPERLPRLRDGANTASQFFGIPVTGREIAFLIDTSGSMDQAIAGTASGRRSQRDPNQPSRLMAAKEQLLLAVQVMPAESRYHLLTFADHAQDWSRKAVPPTPAATRSLNELLSRLQAAGGTNMYEGLVQALSLDQLYFGQEGKVTIDELFVLSDGEPTEGAVKDPEALLEIVREANRYLHVRINTVFTGVGKGGDLLRRLAEDNSGVYVGN